METVYPFNPVFVLHRTTMHLAAPLKPGPGNASSVLHAHSANSTDTDLSTLDNHELWLPDSRWAIEFASQCCSANYHIYYSCLCSIKEPTPTTMTALHQFGAEMLKLSRGLESVASSSTTGSPTKSEFSLSNHLQLQYPSSPQRYAATHQQSHHHNHQQHPAGVYHQQASPKGRHGTTVLGLSTTTLGIERESTRIPWPAVAWAANRAMGEFINSNINKWVQIMGSKNILSKSLEANQNYGYNFLKM